MEQHGNTTTFNLENVLYQNIQRSLYYTESCAELENVEQCIDEIYDNVDHIEPWMSGNARGPSTCFCMIYRLALLKPTVKQLKDMIDHKDSPFIRAVSPWGAHAMQCMGQCNTVLGLYLVLLASARGMGNGQLMKSPHAGGIPLSSICG